MTTTLPLTRGSQGITERPTGPAKHGGMNEHSLAVSLFAVCAEYALHEVETFRCGIILIIHYYIESICNNLLVT